MVLLAGVRWDFLWQRHHELAVRFARAGYRTVFVETTGFSRPRPDARALARRFLGLRRGSSKEPALTVHAPRTLPPTNPIFRAADRLLLAPRLAENLRAVSGPSPIVIAYLPTWTTLYLASRLSPGLLVYDLCDDYAAFPGTPPGVEESERELLGRSDLVLCTSEVLLQKARRVRPDAVLCGPAVDCGRFASLRRAEPVRRVRTVCFFGDIAAHRLDLGVLEEVVRSGFVFRLIGRMDRCSRRLLRIPGIDYRGEVSYEELPRVLRGVDAFVLPYRSGRLTRAIFPAKTYECLATGLPVVASPLPAFAGLEDAVYLARDPREFIGTLRSLGSLETLQKARRRISLAEENSWEARFSQIEGLLWEQIRRRG
ncbi:glycosyltransferase [Rubrobacter calidifluminis]|uniref:glycosyltransferase n=1 Tax=Rubrobacter calidifluminis TaxID=1392640 RepID=UPI00235E32F0|nr:glycosyltransferase [Rubrobacter calidifluminis]